MRAQSWAVGERVILVTCNDPYTKILPGTHGTVSFLDDAGTIFVDWDDGSRLGMVEEAGDQIRKISTPRQWTASLSSPAVLVRHSVPPNKVAFDDLS